MMIVDHHNASNVFHFHDEKRIPTSFNISSSMDVDEDDDERANSYFTTLCHIMAVSIGPTVFIIPYAFSMVGYVTALIGIVIICIFYTYNVHLILGASREVAKRRNISNISFAETVKYSFEDSSLSVRIFAPYAYQLVNILMIISWGGEQCFNVVFICSNIKYIMDKNFHLDLDLRLFVIILFVPCLLASFTSKFDLSILSATATIIDVIFMIFVVFACYSYQETFKSIERDPFKNVYNTPVFLATIFFTLNFTGIVFPLRNEMKQNHKFDSKFGTFTVSVFLVCALNAICGFLGYWRYGNEVQTSLTLNLPQNDSVTVIFTLLYCFGMLCSYPVLFLVIYEIVWQEWVSVGDKLINYNKNKKRYLKFFVKTCINLVIFAVIIIIPKLSWFANIGGLICAVLDGIMLPSIIDILLVYDTDRKRFWRNLPRNMFIIVFGIILLCFGLRSCIHDIVYAKR